MTKVLCALYPDPEAGMPTSYPRDSVPQIATYANGASLSVPASILRLLASLTRVPAVESLFIRHVNPLARRT